MEPIVSVANPWHQQRRGGHVRSYLPAAAPPHAAAGGHAAANVGQVATPGTSYAAAAVHGGQQAHAAAFVIGQPAADSGGPPPTALYHAAQSATFSVASSSELTKLPSEHAIYQETSGRLQYGPETVVRRAPVKAPIGRSIRRMGQKHLYTSGSELEIAESEHASQTSCFISDEQISKEWGHGIVMYFAYTRWSALAAFLMSGLVLIPFCLNWSRVRDQRTIAAAFIALYAPIAEVRWAWVATTAACVLVSIIATALWRLYRERQVARWRGSARVEETLEHTDQLDDAAVRALTNRERTFRKVVSLLVFCLLVAVQGAVTWYLHVALAGSDAAFLGLAVSAALSSLNMVERQVAKLLTLYEGHATVTAIRRWDCAKAFALKLFNVLVVYLMQALTVDARRAAKAEQDARAGGARPPGDSGISSDGVLLLSCWTDAQVESAKDAYYWDELSKGRSVDRGNILSFKAANYMAGQGASCNCPLLSMGWTFFFMCLTDIAFCTVVDYLVNKAFILYYKHQSARSNMSDQDTRPEFDTAEKYVQQWNRTFLILLGAPVFPLIAPLGFVGFILQYWYDRWALTGLCRRPTLQEEPLSLRLTVICAVLVSCAAVATYPNGMAFILARTSYGMTSCHFFEGW